jgi:hypothetical protein
MTGTIRPFTALALALVVILTAGGCYESSIPLGEPGAVGIDPALVGEWRCVPPPEDPSNEEATLTVMPFDAAQYYAEWVEKNEKDRYRVYGTRVGRVVLLNVHSVPASSGKWAFFRYRIDPAGELHLSMVSDKAMAGLDERAALRAIRNRVAEETIYVPVAVCTRRAR